SLALKSDGSLYAWGSNSFGQLGEVTTTNQLTPVQVCAIGDTAPCTSFLSVRASKSLTQPAIAAGQQHSIAVLADSSVAAWGHNNLGQLGTGAADVVAHAIALPVPTIVTAASVQAGDSFSMALMGDSTVDA